MKPGALDHAARISRVRSLLERIGRLPKTGGTPADACMFACQDGIGWEDIYYLCGFMGSSSVFVVTKDDAVLFVDPRYSDAAKACGSCRSVSCADVSRLSPLQAALDFIAAKKPRKVAYGGKRFSHVTYRYVEKCLGSDVELLDVSSVLLNYRRQKSEAEVGFIRKAAEIAARALVETVAEVRAGVTEREFAALLEFRMKSYGADFVDPAPVMVASGVRTSQPHAHPTDRRMQRGDLVLVDFGARVSGYVCDITRMLSVGEPSEEIKSLYTILKWAQTEAASLIGPGCRTSAVDAASRGVLSGANLGDYFVHGAGHGIGLSMHEQPSLSAASGAALAAGDVLAVEPGFYRPGWGGMRLEDDFLVTADGCERLTTGLSNELFVIQ